MITAVFKRENSRLLGFEVSGHANYDETGFDIVCASVTSAVQLTANSITHFFDIDSNIHVEENLVKFNIISKFEKIEAGMRLIESLKNHLELIAEEFKNTIEIKIAEV